MDVRFPLRAVIPTLDGPVLSVLAGTNRPLTGLEVHRLAEVGSPAGVRRVLHRLVDHGMVHVEEAGAALLFTANRHHLAWPAVELLVGMRRRLRDRLRQYIAAEFEPRPALAGLYGSAARGDGDTESDIDILLVRPDGIPDPLEDANESPAQRWAAQVDALRDAVWSMTGNACHIYDITETQFRQTLDGDPLGDSWRRDLIELAGRAPWRRATGGADQEMAR